MRAMPLYKEQGVVLRSVKLGEADKIVTVMTQGSGKVRAVAKGIRKTTSRFGARLEPFTHVSVMVYRGRGSLDTVSQVAASLDVQPAFVRRLDTEGVVVPDRTSGGQRRYSRDEVDHIAALVQLVGEGLTLAGAQRIIELENEIAELRRQLARLRTS